MHTHIPTFLSIIVLTAADITERDVEFLNELPLDKLLRLKHSLHELVQSELQNVTSTTPDYVENFGAQAMAFKALPVKRGDYEEVYYKKDHYSSKISNIFSMSVTTLAFLAFGGYLLCLIVQAIKAKQMYSMQPTTVSPTFLISAGIKKRPQPSQFASYGRRRRAYEERSLQMLDLPPEDMFSALLHLCEGYAKWTKVQDNV